MTGASTWVFSSDLSTEDHAQIQGLIALNGLSASEAASEPADADAAFARMVAAYPGATVIGPPQEEASTSVDEADALYARVAAAHPDATIIRGPAGGALPSVLGASPTTAELARSSAPAETDEAAQAAAADAAFAQMLAAHPGSRELAPGVYSIGELPTGEQSR